VEKTTESFYNNFSDKYTDAIIKCVPRYFEMIEMLFLSSDFRPVNILELGCGTGNLTKYIVKNFPSAIVTAVDISEDLLKICKKRVGGKNVCFVKSDFAKLKLNGNSFDLVISSIAIHHLENKEKIKLFENIFAWLKPKGIFTFADQFKGVSEEIYEKHIKLWRENAKNSNVSDEEWALWMEHQNLHDFHETIENQLLWLKDVGFTETDILWKYALWTVVSCKK